jgi:hypothetical protein
MSPVTDVIIGFASFSVVIYAIQIDDINKGTILFSFIAGSSLTRAFSFKRKNKTHENKSG